MSSPIAFSITHAQIDAMRDLPRPADQAPAPVAALIGKGLAVVEADQVIASPAGVYLLQALTGLALSKRTP